MVVMPVVNRITNEWQAGRVLRLNMSFPGIRAYAKQMEVVKTPTFIVLDENGREMMRWVGEAPDWSALPGNS
jgi:hypothetical protein